MPFFCSDDSLPDGFSEATDRKDEYRAAEQRQCRHLRPEDVEADPLEEDSPDDDEVVAERVQVGGVLDALGHVLDGEGEAREEHGGEGEHEGAHHRLLLSAAQRGDEEAEAKGAHEEEGGGADEQQDAPPEGDVEPEEGDAGDDCDVDVADDGERHELADDEFPSLDRRDDDLLHGADLLLAHHRHAGEHHGGDEDHGGDDPRHIEVAALQVVVEPGAAFELYPAEPCRPPPLPYEVLRHDLAAELLRNLHRIAHDDPGGARVGAVDDDLERCCPPGADLFLEPPVHLHRGPHRPPVEEVADLLLPPHPPYDVEVAGALQPGHQVAARGAVVLVVDRGGDMLDVGVDRVAEEGDLDRRDHEDDEPHLRVPQDLDCLFYEHGLQTLEHGHIFFRNFRTARAKTSDPKTARKRISPMRTRSPTPLR